MPRVLHTADTHIGYRQYHSEARRRDFLAAFEAVIDDAIEADVDAVIHAGDLFHDKRPDLRDLQGTVAALARLKLADIPFIGIVGNHERKRDTQWLDLFADLDLARRLGTEATMIEDVAVYGLDYRTPSTRAPEEATFEPVDDATATLLIGHGIIEGLPYGDWDLDAVLDGAEVSIDGVLLGDYHEHELEHRNGTVITYPGSTERASADERTPRGYNLVTIEDGSVSVAHRTIAETRRFVYIDLELAPDEGESRVFDRLEEHDLDDAVAIVTIDGDGEPVSPAAVEARALDHGAIVARVRDRRETQTGGEGGDVAVSFGDPDQAVTSALSEIYLSETAHELDSLIRDLTTPDTRVREQARERIETVLEEDPAALARPVDVEERAADEDQEEEIDVDDDPEVAADDEDGRDELVASNDGQASMEDYL